MSDVGSLTLSALDYEHEHEHEHDASGPRATRDASSTPSPRRPMYRYQDVLGMTASPLPASAPAARARRRPRHPLQRKLVLWTVAMVAVPTFLCALWLDSIARQAMSATHARNVAMLGQTLAAALAGRDHGDDAEAGNTLQALGLDPRLAFAAVTDPEGHILHRRVLDMAAWSAYVQRVGLAGATGMVDVDRPIVLDEDSELIARKAPIWGAPLRGVPAEGPETAEPRPSGSGAAGSEEAGTAPARARLPSEAHAPARARLPSAEVALRGGNRLEGFAIVALRERGLSETRWRLRAMLLGAACVVCLLSLPVVYWAVRHWTAPLRALCEATERLSRGETPGRVPITTQDEVAELTTAFNSMAGNLLAARRQLEQANQELERKVAARTAELEKLTQRLEAEIRDKNEFLRAVSHDLGAPLRNIQGMAGMLLLKYRADLADDALTKLERISANAKVQLDLIGELLELSRIRTKPGAREVVDLHVLVSELAQDFAFDLERGGIALTLADHLPTVRVERNRLRQVFQNLIDNAVKYMALKEFRVSSSEFRVEETNEPAPSGPVGAPNAAAASANSKLETRNSKLADAPRITIHYRQAGDRLEFSVADTGPGIAPEDLPQLFQLFRRGTHSGAHRVPGRGVGLANVKAIVETYGGTVWADSQLGVGTTFHFTLEAEQVDPQERAAAMLSAVPAKA